VDRVVAWARAGFAAGYEQAWARLAGPGGFFGKAGLPASRPGERCTLATSAGDRLDGVAMLSQPPFQFAATIDGWNDALLRAHLYGGTAMVWLSTYGVVAGRVRELERKWQEALERVFPAA
jgi:hypothetical protein